MDDDLRREREDLDRLTTSQVLRDAIEAAIANTAGTTARSAPANRHARKRDNRK